MTIKTVELKISGMTCNHCAENVEKLLSKAGVLSRKVSYPTNSALVTYDDERISLEEIRASVDVSGPYGVIGFHEITDGSGIKPHLVVIGGGSAAFAATIRALEAGAQVTMINSGLPLGGTCVNVGCVPSKNLIRAAETLHRAKKSPFPGIETRARLVNFRAVREQKRNLVETIRQEKYLDVVANMENVRLVTGRATLIAPDSVEVNGETIAADAILIATGARPAVPDLPGLDEVDYLTNESAFELEELPDSLIVVGGRYIALETAQMFARLGSKVTVLQRSERILPTESPEISRELSRYLQAEGVEIVTGVALQQVRPEKDGIVVTAQVQDQVREFVGRKILFATGRRPNSDEMGLEEVGVQRDESGFVIVDDYLQTSVPGIYAAGDVIGGNMFVYTAAYEGKLAAANALSPGKQQVDYRALPWVIFTDPQVAGVGLNELQARAAGLEFETTMLEMKHVPRAQAARDTRGFIKLIRDKYTNRLLGARILAPEGGELLMEVALAIKFGITVDQLKEMFHPYLTLSEGIKLAAISFSKDVAELSCCAT